MSRTALRDRLEYAGLQFCRTLVLSCPIDMNLRLAQTLGWVWSRVVRRSYDRAVENIAAALGDQLRPPEIERIALRSIQNFVMTGIELLQSPRLINRWSWPQYVTLNNVERVLDMAMAGKPAIMVTGHFGNFELLGQLMACLLGRFTAVMRPMNNELINRFLLQTRRHTGLELIMKKGAVGAARRLLEDGQFVGFMPDQNAGSTGVFVDFFGRPASTVKTVALLACEQRVPVVVGFCRRTGPHFHHAMGVERIIEPDEWAGAENPVHWITQMYTHVIEGMVRRHPEQYLWAHRRWKSRPRGADPASAV
jgi:KDO2-lipid IV(A) lauroyltransferase